MSNVFPNSPAPKSSSLVMVLSVSDDIVCYVPDAWELRLRWLIENPTDRFCSSLYAWTASGRHTGYALVSVMSGFQLALRVVTLPWAKSTEIRPVVSELVDFFAHGADHQLQKEEVRDGSSQTACIQRSSHKPVSKTWAARSRRTVGSTRRLEQVSPVLTRDRSRFLWYQRL